MNHSSRLIALGSIIAVSTWLGCQANAWGDEWGPDPSQMHIRDVVAYGTGCPSGTASVTLSPDAKAMSIIFDHFLAELQGWSGERDAKNCVVNIQLNVPAGWSFTLFSADYRGFVDLSVGSFATHQASYYLDGRAAGFQEQKFKGPMTDSYGRRDEIPVSARNWSSCESTSKVLSIQTVISANRPRDPFGKLPVRGGPALIQFDSVDANLGQVYGINWRRCGQEPASQYVRIHRFLSSREHFFTTSFDEGLLAKMSFEGVAFTLFKNQAPGQVPLYRCYSTAIGAHFVSTDSACEAQRIGGARFEGLYGYAYQTQQPGTLPLYRYVNPRTQVDRLATLNANEGVAAKYQLEGILGYVLPPT